MDTARVDGKLALSVRTRDAWSLQPRFTGRLAADGTLTGTFGVTEINLAGSGNAMRVWYVRETDRDGMDLRLTSNRLASTQLAANATWLNLSDRDVIAWYLSNPFRALSDRSAFYYEGRNFRGRIPQYVRHNPDDLQTIEWRRRAQIHRLTGAVAPVASPQGFFRIGATLEVRHEEHLRMEHPGIDVDSLDATVPDSVYGLIGVYADWRRARFERVERFNGFSEEDQDLSDRVFVSVKLAHERLGYRSTGIGARLRLSSGRRAAPRFSRVRSTAAASSTRRASTRATYSARERRRCGRRSGTRRSCKRPPGFRSRPAPAPSTTSASRYCRASGVRTHSWAPAPYAPRWNIAPTWWTTSTTCSGSA